MVSKLNPESFRGRKAAASRAKILATAKAEFAQRGYEAANMRAIAAAAGMSTGAIFAHFTDKAALWAAAMGRPAPDVRAFIAELAARGETLLPLSIVRVALRLRDDLYGPPPAAQERAA